MEWSVLQLNLEPGFKGSTLLFGEPHTWVSYRHMDNAEVKGDCGSCIEHLEKIHA